MSQFDHITFVVTDVPFALKFFAILGFEQTRCGQRGSKSYEQELPAFLDRKLHYVEGPAGVTVELAQWLAPRP